MSRHFFQRWSVVFLLVGRLIFGELAHATPHEMPTQPVSVPAQADQEPCTEHLNGADAAALVIESATSAHHEAEHDKDCCKATACECACVHVSALDAPSLAVHLVLIDHGRLPAFTPGLLERRPSALFRPPA